MIEDVGNPQHVALLAGLNSCPDLAPYNLTLYYACNDSAEDASRGWCAIIQDPLSHTFGHLFLHKSLDDFLEPGLPSVVRYDGGQLCFVVPFTRHNVSYFLLGEGSLDPATQSLPQSLSSRHPGVEVFPLLPDDPALPSSSLQEIAKAARRVVAVLPSLPSENEPLTATATAVPRLAQTVACLNLLEEAGTIAATTSICADLLGSLFDSPCLAIAWRGEEGSDFAIFGAHGWPEHLDAISAAEVSELIRPKGTKRPVRLDGRLQGVFPGLQARTVTTFPITSRRMLLGFISLVDRQLRGGDLLLVELITTRLAANLMLLKKEQEHARLRELSDRLMSLANTLLLSESKEDLYKVILEIAADLLKACQGSVMVIDKNGENMDVVYSKGMSCEIARYLKVRVGIGIAGRVAKSGLPLLVKDVEKDLRTAMRNRPRFKSKSLISIPLKVNDKVLGVLNLSDKVNLATFSESDLNLLTSFSTLAALMIERAVVLEDSCRFEQLSLTDPLTAIYNRRFLVTRLEEELHRSLRQGLELSILFIDLDYFKNYNDRYGHLSGDTALRKTADIIKASLRDMDCVARYGGEEFCVLLPGTSKPMARLVAERIREGIERESCPAGADLREARLTASLGLASYPEDGCTMTELLHASDMALYQAKEGGRNRVGVAQSVPPEDSPSQAVTREQETSAARQKSHRSRDLCELLQAAVARKDPQAATLVRFTETTSSAGEVEGGITQAQVACVPPSSPLTNAAVPGED